MLKNPKTKLTWNTDSYDCRLRCRQRRIGAIKTSTICTMHTDCCYKLLVACTNGNKCTNSMRSIKTAPINSTYAYSCTYKHRCKCSMININKWKNLFDNSLNLFILACNILITFNASMSFLISKYQNNNNNKKKSIPWVSFHIM